MITLNNIKNILNTLDNPVKKSRVYGSNNINTYILLEDLKIELSNKQTILIPKRYIWDLASVPRFLWALVPPDSDAELSFVIHDYLYQHHVELNITFEFANTEMLIWSKVTNGTSSKISIRNLDNYARYYAVKFFGRGVFNKNKIK